MLRREDELRLSDKVQELYAKRPEDGVWKTRVTINVQRQVCSEFGFVVDIEDGLDLLRSASTLYPNDREIKESAHWLKYNICEPCPINIGSSVPDVQLHQYIGTEETTKTSLRKVIQSVEVPTLLIAGSHT